MAENMGEISPNSVNVPRIPEVGYGGLRVINGAIYEQCVPELQAPYRYFTYKEMLRTSTIATAVDYVLTWINSIPWRIEAPDGYEEELKEQVKFLNSIKDDMVHPFQDAVRNASWFSFYGFSVLEIVRRRRLKSKGSKFNDGKIGIKKLAFRSQDTITHWEYSNNGRDLVGLWQAVRVPTNKSSHRNLKRPEYTSTIEEQYIPLDRVLLFRNNPYKDSPEGTSPLDSVWEDWKFLKAYEETEASQAANDLHGFRVLYMPPQFLRESATIDEKRVLEAYKQTLAGAYSGKEGGMILPQSFDEKGNKNFEFKVENLTGNHSNKVAEIIERYKKQILTAMYADLLVMGQGGGGSFALSDSKLSVVQMIIRSKLEEMKSVFNHQLVPRIMQWNGMENDEGVYPVFAYGEPSEIPVEEFTKGVQRVGAVKMLPRTPENANHILKKLGFTKMVDVSISPDDFEKLLDSSVRDTRAAEGMQQGMPNGTGDSVGGSGDASTSNSENK